MVKIELSEHEWKKKLTDEQYAVCRQKGTERAFTGKYHNYKGEGQYQTWIIFSVVSFLFILILLITNFFDFYSDQLLYRLISLAA